jgi:hypothetical protein
MCRRCVGKESLIKTHCRHIVVVGSVPREVVRRRVQYDGSSMPSSFLQDSLPYGALCVCPVIEKAASSREFTKPQITTVGPVWEGGGLRCACVCV